MKRKTYKPQLNVLFIVVFLCNVIFPQIYGSCTRDYLNKTILKGSGKIATLEVPIRNCHKINFSGQGEVVIEQGKKAILNIEADENILPTIQTEFSDKTLSINFSKTHLIKDAKKLKFHITVNTLSLIYLNGDINLKCSNLETNDLDICTYGNVTLEIKKLKTPNLNVYSFGNSNIVITGETDKQVIHLNGESHYDGQKLKSLETQIQTFSVEQHQLLPVHRL